MLTGLPKLSTEALLQWVRKSISENTHRLSNGYQAVTYLYEDDDCKLVIKAPPKSWWLHWFYVAMIRHEYKVYQCLHDVAGIPRCYGLLDKQYLVLEYIEGKPLREATFTDREKFIERLLFVIKKMHAIGVAHGDLKKKDNVMAAEDDKPYLIDFGVASIRKSGFRPFNKFIFSLAQKFDLNAWVKHKYNGQYHAVSDRDKIYFKRTFLERFSRKVKRGYRSLFTK